MFRQSISSLSFTAYILKLKSFNVNHAVKVAVFMPTGHLCLPTFRVSLKLYQFEAILTASSAMLFGYEFFEMFRFFQRGK